jgi:peptidoglycan hydrolase CwlO-like protein
MSNDIIFYTQIASIVIFILALLGVYRSLVAQKDGVIELLREQLRQQKSKIRDLMTQSPDALATALSERVEIAVSEIERLKQDGGKHKEEIERKEKELNNTREQMLALAELITEAGLACPHCSSPLSQRGYYPVYGHIDGREIEADIEYSVYDCVV